MVRNGYATTAEARQALDRPLPLRSGAPLPPLRGVSIAPGPPFFWGELALGLAVAAIATVGLFGLRGGRSRLPRAATIAARAGATLALVVGVFLVLGSFRGA
jgi:hypothetical protein